jgi:DNA-binding SARP family transcriptional activator
MIMSDELIELKERVVYLGEQLKRMENDFEIAIRTGEISNAKAAMKRLISEAQSMKEIAEALMSKYQLEGKDVKFNLCLKLLKYIENIENVISLRSCSFIFL